MPPPRRKEKIKPSNTQKKTASEENEYLFAKVFNSPLTEKNPFKIM